MTRTAPSNALRVLLQNHPNSYVSWHLEDAQITQGRVLTMQLHQKIASNGEIQCINISDNDYVMACKGRDNRLRITFGIFASSQCKDLTKLIKANEQYDFVRIGMHDLDTRTGERRNVAMRQHSESLFNLSIRHAGQIHAFGEKDPTPRFAGYIPRRGLRR